MAGTRTPPTFPTSAENAMDTINTGLSRLVKALRSQKHPPAEQQRKDVLAAWNAIKTEGDRQLAQAVPPKEAKKKTIAWSGGH